MKRRMTLWLAAGLLMVVGSLVVSLLRDPINKANWDRITDGMSTALSTAVAALRLNLAPTASENRLKGRAPSTSTPTTRKT